MLLPLQDLDASSPETPASRDGEEQDDHRAQSLDWSRKPLCPCKTESPLLHLVMIGSQMVMGGNPGLTST